MEIDLFQAALIVVSVYVFTRLVNHVEHTQRLEKRKKAEQERLNKVAALYGREK